MLQIVAAERRGRYELRKTSEKKLTNGWKDALCRYGKAFLERRALSLWLYIGRGAREAGAESREVLIHVMHDSDDRCLEGA